MDHYFVYSKGFYCNERIHLRNPNYYYFDNFKLNTFAMLLLIVHLY